MYTEMTTYYAMWDTPQGGVGSAHFYARSEAQAIKTARSIASNARQEFLERWPPPGPKLRPAWFRVRLVAREDDGSIIYRRD